MDIKKKVFTESLIKYWNKLHRKLVMTSSPSVFKKHLGKALKYMV